jgi:hypothetical protein
MRQRRRAVVWALVAIAAGCGGAPRRSKSRPHFAIADDPNAKRSTEWLYATQSSRGVEDCEQVRQVLVGEAGCASASCSHARRLARDWMAVCRGRARAGEAAEIQRLGDEFARRAANPAPSACEQAERWLRDGCGKNGACEAEAEEWATRCGQAVKSPLLIAMLEKSIEQSQDEPHPVKLDTRSCDDLAHEVVSAADCDHQFACQDSLPKVTLWHSRCPTSEAKPMALRVAAAELAIRQGAGESPDAIPVEPEPAPAALREVPLALESGDGAVLRVCGKRARELASYLDLCRGCTDGEVVVVKTFPAGSRRELRIGTFDHPNDVTWFRRWPTSLVAGEREHREQAQAGRLKARFDELIRHPRESAEAQRAWRDLLRTFGELEPSLGRSPVLAQSLSEMDGALLVWFMELGRRKRQAKTDGLRPLERYAYANRSLGLPLADLAADGKVEIGAQQAGSQFDLGLALPRSVGAYRAELAPSGKTVAPKPADLKAEAALRDVIRSLGSSCRDAEQAAQLAEQAWIDCGFHAASCDVERRQALGRALDKARKEAGQMLRGAALAVASLPAASRPELPAEACPR